MKGETRHPMRKAVVFAALMGFGSVACGQPAVEADATRSTEQARAVEVLLRAELPTTPSERAPLPEFETDPRFETPRRQMVDVQIAARDVRDPRVLAAMRRVPRHRYVEAGAAREAYQDYPLAIGHGQTISQPYIVATMTEFLELEPTDRVLEIGTGSGYQASIAAEIAREVVTIEIVDPLARQAAQRLERLGYKNITALYGDGYFGWEEAAPYDAIVVTAAARHVPPPLTAQLRPGGRMIIPVGEPGLTQNLLLIEKDENGEMRTRNVMAVRFVPLTRQSR